MAAGTRQAAADHWPVDFGYNCSATGLNVKPRQPGARGSTARGARPGQGEEQLVRGRDERHLPGIALSA